MSIRLPRDSAHVAAVSAMPFAGYADRAAPFGLDLQRLGATVGVFVAMLSGSIALHHVTQPPKAH